MLLEAEFPKIYGITNSVICTPYDSSSRESIRVPSSQETKNCSARLEHLIKISKAKVLVAIGQKAKMQLTKLKYDPYVMIHPSSILRSSGGKGSSGAKGIIEFKKNVLLLKKILEDLND